MKIAIILLHFRNSKDTLPCMNSLAQIKSIKFETYIISMLSDNAEKLKKHPINPIVVEESNNLGFAGANNVLIKRAMADGCTHLILLNNDTIVDPGFIEPLIKALDDKKVGMVAPKIYFYPGKEFHFDDYKESERGKVIWYAGGIFDWNNVFTPHWGVDEVDHGQFEDQTETDFATGCCVAITAETVDKIGLMSEKYFLYFEDADWSMQCKLSGLKIVVEPKSKIWHVNSGSTGGSGSKLQMYYQTRNRNYFGLKYAPWRTKIHLIWNAIGDLKSDNPNLRKGVRDFFLGRMGKQEIE